MNMLDTLRSRADFCVHESFFPALKIKTSIPERPVNLKVPENASLLLH